jgi:hypothetical protein
LVPKRDKVSAETDALIGWLGCVFI